MTRAPGVLVVTGGSRGIGAHVAAQASAAGWAVVLSYVESKYRADAVVSAIRRDGGVAFTGSTPISRIKRTFEELVGYLFRNHTFPTGVVLSTGTGIVPPARRTDATHLCHRARGMDRPLRVAVRGHREASRRVEAARRRELWRVEVGIAGELERSNSLSLGLALVDLELDVNP